MTKRETDRIILRAFGNAARAMMNGYASKPALALDLYERGARRAGDRPTPGNRRNRAYARHYAHALATAWGL
jgi:hypothetical protein